jgi:hypothetical protein
MYNGYEGGISSNPSAWLQFLHTSVLESIIYQETVISVLLHILFSVLGIFYSPVYHAFHLIMFVFVSESIMNILKAIVKNVKEIVLIFLFAIFIIYIYSIITLIHYYDNFRTDETRGYDVCLNLWSCFLNVLDLGLRIGGGIGESMSVMYST